jgi:hypothetical protein
VKSEQASKVKSWTPTAFGRGLVTPALDEHVEDDAVLVDRPPQPKLFLITHEPQPI